MKHLMFIYRHDIKVPEWMRLNRDWRETTLISPGRTWRMFSSRRVHR